MILRFDAAESNAERAIWEGQYSKPASVPSECTRKSFACDKKLTFHKVDMMEAVVTTTQNISSKKQLGFPHCNQTAVSSSQPFQTKARCKVAYFNYRMINVCTTVQRFTILSGIKSKKKN